MYKKQFHDLELTILESQEAQEVIRIIQSESEKRMQEMRKITLPQGINACDFFVSTNSFEDQIVGKDLNFNLSNTETYQYLTDYLSESFRDYWELPYLNGKNILAAMQARENKIIDERAIPHMKERLDELKTDVLNKLQKSEDYLQKAVFLFNQFGGDNSLLKAYETQMKGYLATIPRRQAQLIARSSINPLTPEILSEVIPLTLKISALFYNLFNEGIFLDEKNVAINMTNFAHALKFCSTPKNHERGLEYYEEARKILGDERQIVEGIKYYQQRSWEDVYREHINPN